MYDSRGRECPATDTLQPLQEIIGQERALRALTFGLEIPETGFNIYVAGIAGTGRKTAVMDFLERLAKTKPKAGDWVYVNSFTSQYEPNAIRLPPGKGSEFRDEMADFISEVKKNLPKAFESEDYATRRQATVRSIEEEKAKLFGQINASAQEQGFVIQMSPTGLLTIPVVDGKPLPEEEFVALPDEMKAEIGRRMEKLNTDLRNAFRQVRDLDSKGAEAVDKLNREVSLFAIGHLITDLREKYHDLPEILKYIEAVQNDILENLDQFLGAPQQPQVPPQLQPFFKELPFKKYQVNAIVDNSKPDGAPVVFEQNPTYQNLFGKVEKEVQFGIVSTDFTMIRPGSVHKANGGYMVIPVEDLLRNPFAWDGIKTALKTGEVAIEEPGERMGFITTRGLKPEPIPLAVKLVLIGTPQINQLLYSLDPDFKDLFKVRADFDIVMDRNDENALRYEAFICTLCSKSKMLHLERGAVAKVMEFASRLADDQEKFSTRFSSIGDLIREANFYAAREGSGVITAAHMTRAIDEKIYRSSLIQEKIREFITRGVFLIDTEGAKAGQVNGLSVTGTGDYAFGTPSRVTASIGVGREGIVDIEREAAMGGPIHTKGVLILHGYLAGKFARDKPLSISARLVFEQSYSGVEGDSASSTELYALLSALSGLPIRQDLAVTGSVNQKGEVQAIGGVNEKLEGFFEVCRAKGLTGKQGAMIPASNVQNLMLKEEMVEAGKTGQFTIYPVKTIDEGIEVLTGVPAGKRRKDGTYPEGTVNYLVDKKLREMAETYREFQPGAR
ncbi:MAG: AAA family ATPase [Methanomicrobiales archaeon]|nr:AAA family ATPase [Methanomicrobiales archaeon]